MDGDVQQDISNVLKSSYLFFLHIPLPEQTKAFDPSNIIFNERVYHWNLRVRDLSKKARKITERLEE